MLSVVWGEFGVSGIHFLQMGSSAAWPWLHHFTCLNLFCPLQELKEPLAATKAELDAAAFDVQLLISEHAQDLTPQQSRQLLRLLNELQKSFRDLSERVTARLEVLQVCLQQVEQTEQVKLVRFLLPLLAEAFPSHRSTSSLGFPLHATPSTS